MIAFLNVTPYSSVEMYQHIGGTCCLHLQSTLIVTYQNTWRHIPQNSNFLLVVTEMLG
jgi:hypothetical protein